MNRPQYNEEELKIIQEWGIPSDLKFDSERIVYDATGTTRVTALDLAKQRKSILQKTGKKLIDHYDLKKAA